MRASLSSCVSSITFSHSNSPSPPIANANIPTRHVIASLTCAGSHLRPSLRPTIGACAFLQEVTMPVGRYSPLLFGQMRRAQHRFETSLSAPVSHSRTSSRSCLRSKGLVLSARNEGLVADTYSHVNHRKFVFPKFSPRSMVPSHLAISGSRTPTERVIMKVNASCSRSGMLLVTS